MKTFPFIYFPICSCVQLIKLMPILLYSKIIAIGLGINFRFYIMTKLKRKGKLNMSQSLSRVNRKEIKEG